MVATEMGCSWLGSGGSAIICLAQAQWKMSSVTKHKNQ